MPKLSVSIPHALTQEEALRRLKDRLELARGSLQEHVSNLQEHWEGNEVQFSFTTHGFGVKGCLRSEPSEVRVQADLPLPALIFKKMLEQQIREELTKVLS